MRIDKKRIIGKLPKFWKKEGKPKVFITPYESEEKKLDEQERLIPDTPLESEQFKDLLNYVAKGDLYLRLLKEFIGDYPMIDEKDTFIVQLKKGFSDEAHRDIKEPYKKLYKPTIALHHLLFNEDPLEKGDIEEVKGVFKNVEAYLTSLKDFVDPLDKILPSLDPGKATTPDSQFVNTFLKIFERRMKAIESGEFFKDRPNLWERSSQLRGPNP